MGESKIGKNINILSIDYGKFYTGLAICKDGFIYPLTVIRSRSDKHKIENILRIIKDEEISLIVIGVSFGKLRTTVTGFIKKLKLKTDKEIIEIDETLSSKKAVQRMVNEGLSKKNRSEKEHAYAACEILETFCN